MMTGFHAEGHTDYLQALAERHRKTLAELHEQRRAPSSLEDIQIIEAQIKSVIEDYNQQCRRVSYCLF